MIAEIKAMGFGAFLADASVVVFAALQQTPLPDPTTMIGAGGAGAATSLAVLYAWKGYADKRLDKVENEKADKADLRRIDDSLREIRDDIRYLTRSSKSQEHE